MTKEEVKNKHLEILHQIHLSPGTYEIDMWLEKGEKNLYENASLFSAKEYNDSLMTLRVASGTSKRKLGVHGY